MSASSAHQQPAHGEPTAVHLTQPGPQVISFAMDYSADGSRATGDADKRRLSPNPFVSAPSHEYDSQNLEQAFGASGAGSAFNGTKEAGHAIISNQPAPQNSMESSSLHASNVGNLAVSDPFNSASQSSQIAGEDSNNKPPDASTTSLVNVSLGDSSVAGAGRHRPSHHAASGVRHRHAPVRRKHRGAGCCPCHSPHHHESHQPATSQDTDSASKPTSTSTSTSMSQPPTPGDPPSGSSATKQHGNGASSPFEDPEWYHQTFPPSKPSLRYRLACCCISCSVTRCCYLPAVCPCCFPATNKFDNVAAAPPYVTEPDHHPIFCCLPANCCSSYTPTKEEQERRKREREEKRRQRRQERKDDWCSCNDTNDDCCDFCALLVCCVAPSLACGDSRAHNNYRTDETFLLNTCPMCCNIGGRDNAVVQHHCGQCCQTQMPPPRTQGNITNQPTTGGGGNHTFDTFMETAAEDPDLFCCHLHCGDLCGSDGCTCLDHGGCVGPRWDGHCGCDCPKSCNDCLGDCMNCECCETCDCDGNAEGTSEGCCSCGGCCHGCDGCACGCDGCDCDCDNCDNCDCGGCDCGGCDCNGC